MNARQIEDVLLKRCIRVACNTDVVVDDLREANVFRVAGMILQSRFPLAATNLMRACDQYFALHPLDKLPAAAVVQRGWVASLPRLRDMLSRNLQARSLP